MKHMSHAAPDKATISASAGDRAMERWRCVAHITAALCMHHVHTSTRMWTGVCMSMQPAQSES